MAQIDLAGSPRHHGHVTVSESVESEAGEPMRPGRLRRGLRAVTDGARRLMPAAALSDRDPDVIRENLPLLWLFISTWFRAEVRGLGNLPDDGPVLLVGNHSGGSVTPDTIVFTIAFNTYFGVERAFFALADARGLSWLRQLGLVSVRHEAAVAALRAGAAVLVYPGGQDERDRPSWQGNRIDLGHSTEFIRLALEEGVSIVPVVSIGGQETALFLTRGEGLARTLRLDRLLSIKRVPVLLALPWGLNLGDLLGHLPLPARITIETLPAIDPRTEFGDDPDVQEIYDYLVRSMQATLDALAAERRFPVLG